MLMSPQHGIARGDAAGRGIGEDGNKREADFIEPRERGGYFRELHQADGALHHAGAARTGNNHERNSFRNGGFNRARHFLADHRAHRAADEVELHRATDDRPPAQQALGGDNGVGHAEFLARILQSRRVRFGVRKVQRIVRGECGVVLDPARIEQQHKPLRGVQTEMMLATWGRRASSLRGPSSRQSRGSSRHLVHSPSVFTRRSSGGVG